jgi:hypothetical protein
MTDQQLMNEDYLQAERDLDAGMERLANGQMPTVRQCAAIAFFARPSKPEARPDGGHFLMTL